MLSVPAALCLLLCPLVLLDLLHSLSAEYALSVHGCHPLRHALLRDVVLDDAHVQRDAYP